MFNETFFIGLLIIAASGAILWQAVKLRGLRSQGDEQPRIPDSCSHCVYYAGSDRTGLCRRDTPLIYSEDKPIAIWPVVEPADWCGDGEEKS